MPVKSTIIKPGTGKAIWTPDGMYAPLVGTTTEARTYGQFKTASITEITLGTTIVAPPSNESIVLTDLIISAEKKNLGIDTLRFHDGTNTVNIMVTSVADSPVNIAIAFAGHWHGWKDAYLQVVQAGANHYYSVSIGYYFMPKELTELYARWNNLRDVR
jgi:hypothetical protein